MNTLAITEFQKQSKQATGNAGQECESRYCYRCNRFQINSGGNSKRDAIGRIRWICQRCTDKWQKRSKATAERSMQSQPPKS
jgi:transposase-like protein